MYQTAAIQNYVAGVCGFAPKDPMQVYKGEMLYEAINVDIMFKQIAPKLFMEPGEERDALLKTVKEKHWPAAMATLERHLPADAKFINGDDLTTHDFTIAGGLVNVLDNPSTKDPEFWADLKANATPARVLKYLEDFKEANKEHLANRPQNCSI